MRALPFSQLPPAGGTPEAHLTVVAPEESPDPETEVAAILARVTHAIAALESGRPHAARQLLQQIVELHPVEPD